MISSESLGPHDLAGILQKLPANRGKREAIRLITDVGFRIDRYVYNLAHAVALFRFSNEHYAKIEAEIARAVSDVARRGAKALRSDELQLLGGWELIAARDGAASIFHFGKALADFSETIEKTSLLASAAKRPALKEAYVLFNRYFRGFEGIRNATAHSAETAREAQSRKHAIRGPHKGETFEIGPTTTFYTNGLIDGDAFKVTYEGRLLSYRLRLETATRLRTIEHTLFSTFV